MNQNLNWFMRHNVKEMFLKSEILSESKLFRDEQNN